MRNMVLGVILVFICAFQADEPNFAKMKDVSAFRNGVDQMAASTTSIQASFTQEKYLNVLSDKIVSQGSIHFKKPNLLRWEYHQPFEYGIILNGKEITIKDEGNVNSFDIASSQAFQQVNELIIHSVQGNVLDENRFDIEYLENDDLYLTKLLPKETQMAKFLKGIHIYFDKQNFTVAKIRLIEAEDDYTLITFSDKALNEPISDEQFAIK
ncbi:outer membrane lipoprotein carrier protein LolA [Catalinimonas niigatensis]|uniref:outer membrane lipoprotein carrier protein LolA n=1 Tax=Catalinimonas niigatensis TaxID=1397264 RepID=UPI002665CC9D|nr:outer membrane lipoprotein carrier protein LolA [Catalinimonas niigatensis]WPP48768.1 outer membrane lipoprotein carrier protein LolA [Catalinimonas niigatensis]